MENWAIFKNLSVVSDSKINPFIANLDGQLSELDIQFYELVNTWIGKIADIFPAGSHNRKDTGGSRFTGTHVQFTFRDRHAEHVDTTGFQYSDVSLYETQPDVSVNQGHLVSDIFPAGAPQPGIYPISYQFFFAISGLSHRI